MMNVIEFIKKYWSFSLVLIAAVGVFLWAFFIFHADERLHKELLKNGEVATAQASNLRMSFYQSHGRSGRTIQTDDEIQADSIRFDIVFDVNGAVQKQEMSTRFDFEGDDHRDVYQDVKKGKLKIRYLPSDPSKARPEAEFTDRERNPYGFDW